MLDQQQDNLLQQIRCISRRGLAPQARQVPGLAKEAERRYGSWERACQKAGVTPMPQGKQREKLRQSYLQLLKELLQQEPYASSKEYPKLALKLRSVGFNWATACRRAQLADPLDAPPAQQLLQLYQTGRMPKGSQRYALDLALKGYGLTFGETKKLIEQACSQNKQENKNARHMPSGRIGRDVRRSKPEHPQQA